MQMEYGDQKVDLLRCPFCDSTPKIHGYRHNHQQWYRVRCSNDSEDCAIMPETQPYRKLYDAAKAWNKRPWNQVPENKEDK